MRNWNQIRLLKTAIFIWLPDYLWGIETSRHSAEHRKHLRFQTTYEELKRPSCPWSDFPASASRLPMRNWNMATNASKLPPAGFQTTYEELKPGNDLYGQFCVWLPDYLWGIETIVWAGFWPSNLASRLPMRNWNAWKTISPYRAKLPLPDYLWGIETITALLSRCRNSCRFQTTYEELKPAVPV